MTRKTSPGHDTCELGCTQRVSKLAGAQDRKEIERARSIEEQNKANQDDPALGARSLPYGPVPHR